MGRVIGSYAALNTESPVRMSSSSGGVFFALAETILCEGGVVYGVCMSEDCKSAEYTRTTTEQGLEKMRGSKYLQARVGDAFRRVQKDLDDGLSVLFSGTGCVINGLKSFLKGDRNNLYCIDVVCHGVPSPRLWSRYVDYLEAENQEKIIGVSFRCKDKGWREFGIKQEYIGKTAFSPRRTDLYIQMFLSDLCLRPSCYQCPAKRERAADVSLGDLWGVEKIIPEMDDGRGVSWVIVRTKKGERLFAGAAAKLKFEAIHYEDALRYNSAEARSVIKPRQRDTFFKDLNRYSMPKMKRKYLRGSVKSRIKRAIKNTLKLFARAVEG